MHTRFFTKKTGIVPVFGQFGGNSDLSFWKKPAGVLPAFCFKKTEKRPKKKKRVRETNLAHKEER